MKVLHYRDPQPTRFDNDVAKGVNGRVLIGKEDGAPTFCMRFFELEPGGYTPRHTHDWEHEVFVHSGQGEAMADGEWTPVSAGCAVFVPGGQEHQFRNTGTEPLRFVCLIPSGPPEL